MGMGVHPRPLDWPVGTANITLDPDTAHLQLIVSEDHKSVTCGSEFQDLPDNRKPRVLCRGQTLYCQHMRSTTLPTFSGNPVPSVPGRRMCVRGSYWHRLRPCGRGPFTEHPSDQDRRDDPASSSDRAGGVAGEGWPPSRGLWKPRSPHGYGCHPSSGGVQSPSPFSILFQPPLMLHDSLCRLLPGAFPGFPQRHRVVYAQERQERPGSAGFSTPTLLPLLPNHRLHGGGTTWRRNCNLMGPFRRQRCFLHL
ncbi:uncharacterized protein LOC110088871 isoform X1 [Pogona vitticeps]